MQTEERRGARRLSILGSTGSIGRQTLDVVRQYPHRLRVESLAARRSVAELVTQVAEFRPRTVVIEDPALAPSLQEAVGSYKCRVLSGPEALRDLALDESVDTVVAAVVGFAGLHPVMAALEAGKRVALANKEVLVVAGMLVMEAVERSGAELVPIDSEHSAIFQCLAGEPEGVVEKLILTASGGPFRTRDAKTFGSIRREEALAHPNWTMGSKITIDSATMMNKGLEVIEAHWMFGVMPQNIEVVVHPQSIIHSMVLFRDGSVKAQLGVPDMRVPIQYALSAPERWTADHPRLQWPTLGGLTFEAPDLDRFPCLRLAYEALTEGGTAPAILNGANEQAVQLFLEGHIRFLDIPRSVAHALEQIPAVRRLDIETLVDVDARARRVVKELRPASLHTS